MIQNSIISGFMSNIGESVVSWDCLLAKSRQAVARTVRSVERWKERKRDVHLHFFPTVSTQPELVD